MMTGHLIPVPWGMAHGTPALALDFTGNLPDPDAARRAVHGAMQGRPGLTIAWIRSAPWESEEFASVLDVALSVMPSLYATQPFDARHWGFREVHWFTDCSALLRKPTTSEEIVARVGDLPGFPSPAELLVSTPAAENLTPGLLDVLAMSIGGPATFCELAVAPSHRHVALMAAARASAGWHVRVHSPLFAATTENKIFEVE